MAAIELRVKQNSLANEVRIIRSEERYLTRHTRKADFLKREMRERIHKKLITKAEALEHYADKISRLRARAKKRTEFKTFDLIHYHRVVDVRREARHTNLAVGFLNGTPYYKIETIRYSHPKWDEVERMVLRYGEGDERDRKQKFEQWVQEALKKPLAGGNGIKQNEATKTTG